MSKRPSSKMSSWFDNSQYTEKLPNVSDFLDMPMEIRGVSWRTGMKGEYVVVTATLLDTGAEIKFQTGSIAMRELLHAAENQRRFPFECIIRQVGQAYIPTDNE
jgi:hypothetical protein